MLSRSDFLSAMQLAASSTECLTMDSMVDEITQDMQILQHHVSTSPTVARALSSGLMIADWYIPEIRSHQLQVLNDEYGVDFHTMCASEDDILSVSFSIAQGESPCALQIPSVLTRYFCELQELETSFAKDVRSCRQRDGVRGQSIIPDYAVVNKVATDCGADIAVQRAEERAAFFSSFVATAVPK
jgi:hypothetical protein